VINIARDSPQAEIGEAVEGGHGVDAIVEVIVLGEQKAAVAVRAARVVEAVIGKFDKEQVAAALFGIGRPALLLSYDLVEARLVADQRAFKLGDGLHRQLFADLAFLVEDKRLAK